MAPTVSEIGVAPPGFRLPDETTIGTVVLQVADLERSLDYYQSVLGLRVLDRRDRDDAGAAAALAAHSTGAATVSPILALHERRGARRVPTGGRLGLFHFAMVLPDRPALGRFFRHLLDARIPYGAADHMVSEALYLTDPDGLGIEVYRDRPRAEWIVRNGQVIGGTDPLDSSGVLDAGDGRPWEGVPEGSRIGHVHFHVGDLGQASAFYHEALGFDRVRWPFPGALFVSAGGYHHHVGLNTWATSHDPAADDDARLREWELVLPTPESVEAARDSVESAGYPIAGASSGFRSSDPWGITVCVRTPHVH